jgi:hypothetical protein
MASNDQFQPPPTTRREDFREILDGVEVPDPYRWLEDGDAPETRAWLAAQQEYARPFLDTPIRKRIRARLAELMKIDEIGFPLERSGYYFYSRRCAHEQRGAICRRQGLHGDEEVLVDGNTLSADRMSGVHIAGVSRDGAVLAYGVRHGGEDEFSIHLIDVASRRDLQDLLPRARYDYASWKHDAGPLHLARREIRRMGPTGPYDRSPVPHDCGKPRTRANFAGFSRGARRSLPAWRREGDLNPPSPFRLWAAENSASSAHYFAKLLQNLSQRIYSPSVRHLSNLTGSPQWR